MAPQIADMLLPWVVGVVALVARLATAAVGPTDWDSSQFAAAVSRFDVTHGRPQPPGYFLYVEAGRLVHATGTVSVRSLVIVSALASAAAAGLVVVAGRDLGGRWVGLAAGVVVAASPFVWFNGSTVDTYSFDLLIAPVLMILAWRARPHSWHGAAALAALGLAAGFRQSILQTFALLALLAVVASVRRFREAVVAVGAGLVALAVWAVPMALTQPGGLGTWVKATRAETQGAFRATSVLDHASGGALNFGTFAGYTTLAIAPLVGLAVVSGVVLALRALMKGRTIPRSPTAPTAGPGLAAPAVRPDTSSSTPAGALQATPPRRAVGRRGRIDWVRPWYQSRTAVLAAAIVPPVAVVTLVEFAKGGYLLAYLPGTVIALLLVPAAVLRPRVRDRRTTSVGGPGSPQGGPGSPQGGPGVRVRGFLATTWIVVITLAVGAIAVLGADRFLSGYGVLPTAATTSTSGLWLAQARYQAPYLDTRAAIQRMDDLDASLAALAPHVDAARDVVVIDSVDGGTAFYRNAGWALPADRVTLIVPGTAVYNEQHGSLYYMSSPTVSVGTGGVVYLIAPPSLPGLATLARRGLVTVTRTRPIADYRVWRIEPGARILGVGVVAVPGPRPLGSGITG